MKTVCIIPVALNQHWLATNYGLVVANLTTRLGAVRTLESRLSLIKAYLQSVKSSPPDVLQYPSAPRLSYSLLRSISSLISHLTLLNPRYSNSFSVESLAQANDVALVALLSSMGESIQGMRELGKKSSLELSMRQIPQGRDPHQAMEARTREGPWLMQRGKMGGATWG